MIQHNIDDDTPINWSEVATTMSLESLQEIFEDQPLAQTRQSIRLYVRSGNEIWELPLPESSRLVLGRPSPSSPHKPNIDLSAFDALMLGVSRLHAIIEDHYNIFTITDLYSSNGTFINGRRLQPNEIRFVHDGDTICLGKLVLYVQVSDALDN